MQNLILSILMIAGIALLVGGFLALKKGSNRRQGWLMLVAAAVMFANVAIWAVPVD